jgi:two-component system, OmpR family, phosphate regulon sensor histidine kinase PhoR
VRSRIFLKLLAAFVVVIVAATLILDFAIRRAWESSLREQIDNSLRVNALLFAKQINTDKQHSTQEIAADVAKVASARATVIDSSGKVLADTEADPATMENHASRPEFQSALRGEVGSSTRESRTVGVEFLYMAAPVQGGAVRLAYPLRAIAEVQQQVRRRLLVSSLIAVLIAMVLAAFASGRLAARLQKIVRFSEKISEGDLSARVEESSRDEIAQVASALDKTARRLESSFREIEHGKQRLETLLDSMQEAVMGISADGRVQWANRTMGKILQGSLKTGAPFIESIRDAEFVGAARKALEQKTVQTVRVKTLVSSRSFQATIAPMTGGGAVAVFYDMTELERLEKTRRDFIANVSHELRTPLTSIQGYAETLVESTEPGSGRDFLEIIRKNAARMSRLTEDLLVLARVESGEQKLSKQQVSPAELLDEVQQNFREVMHAHHIALEVANTSNQYVEVDPDAIFQVFTNLVDNALKYGSSGGKIVIGARDVGDAVELFVQDMGQGIASEHLPRLFERFYRVDKARSRESGGTGLGLAIAKHVIIAHGGTIRAESELNHGATFLFTFKATDKPKAHPDQAKMHPVPHGERDEAGGLE